MRDCGLLRFKLRKSDILEASLSLSTGEGRLLMDITMKIPDKCHAEKCDMRP